MTLRFYAFPVRLELLSIDLNIALPTGFVNRGDVELKDLQPSAWTWEGLHGSDRRTGCRESRFRALIVKSKLAFDGSCHLSAPCAIVTSAGPGASP